jgi:hypothetical protein
VATEAVVASVAANVNGKYKSEHVVQAVAVQTSQLAGHATQAPSVFK